MRAGPQQKGVSGSAAHQSCCVASPHMQGPLLGLCLTTPVFSPVWLQFVNVCGVSVGFGFSSACDTLMSQVGEPPEAGQGQSQSLNCCRNGGGWGLPSQASQYSLNPMGQLPSSVHAAPEDQVLSGDWTLPFERVWIGRQENPGKKRAGTVPCPAQMLKVHTWDPLPSGTQSSWLTVDLGT